MADGHMPYWKIVRQRFLHHRIGACAAIIVALFCLMGIYAPFLASSKPFVVEYNGTWYFPLFRYLFFSGYYTKSIDLFFNLLIFTFPPFMLLFFLKTPLYRTAAYTILCIVQLVLTFFFIQGVIKDPASDPTLNLARKTALEKEGKGFHPSWAFDLRYMNGYAKLNMLLQYQQRRKQDQSLQRYLDGYRTIIKDNNAMMPTLWHQQMMHEKKQLEASTSHQQYLIDRREWLESESQKLHNEVMPLLRHFHWEEDAGGSQNINRAVSLVELTRINRKDFLSALIFGVRISLVVGIFSIALALIIGIPIGSLSGYYGGKFDILVCRMMEIWESMPAFFMLLMIVAFLQSKSIFLIIGIIGLFGWTTFSRFARGEFFKQRNLTYVEACHSVGFTNSTIMFRHILPNAIPPILTLLPFAIMGAITSEAGLSFLGLGEEGSASWGVLMDEGRSAFPGESYLLWPPAVLLTALLIAIAIVGDALRDAIDPKYQHD